MFLYFFNHLAAKHSIDIISQIHKTVLTSFNTGIVSEFIHISAGLHAEVANCFKRSILCQYTDIEDAGAFDHFPGQVTFLHGNRQSRRLFCYLNTGVADEAVILVRRAGGSHK